MKYRILLIFLTALFTGCLFHAHTSPPRKIALIHSYQKGYSGSEEINRLLTEELKKNNINPHLQIFYLDCERYDNQEEEKRISLFADSIRQWGADLIAVLDDQATYSLMACRHPYIKQIPVVFSGVNYPNRELLAQYPNITGYIDQPDYYATCQMIERIMGKVRIHILNGRTVLDKLIWKDLSEQCQGTEIVLHQWERKEALPQNMDNIPISEQDNAYYTSLHHKLNEYSQLDSTIFVRLCSDSVAARDLMWLSSGIFKYSLFLYTKRDYTTLRIGSLFDNPGFETINEGFGVKDYLLGGYFAPIETQIKEMAAGIKERLDGNRAQQPLQQLAKEYLVNWKVLKKYHIPLQSIPPEYTIMYMPWKEQHPVLFHMLQGMICLLLLAGISYLLFIYIREKKRKKEVLQTLQTERESLALAIEGSNTYAWSFDGKTVTFDQKFGDLIKHSHTYINIEDVINYIHPDEQARFKRYAYNLLNRQRRTIQYRCNFGSDDYQWWELRYSAIHNDNKNFITGLLLNVQEVKDKELELINARKLAEQAELKQSFLANMSHEIRTPLNAIVGFSNLLTTEKGISDEERKEFVAIIDNNTHLLLKLVNDVLELSRLESGNMSFSLEECSARHFVETMYQTHQLLISAPLELKKDFPEEDIMIRIDRLRLSQVITNFLGNAQKFTSQGYIKLGYFCCKEEKEIHIYVEDTGAGIPKEELQMIFERFYKRNEFVQGVGLGLAISKVIVEKMNGRIEVDSKVNKGSRFSVILPYL